MLPEFTILTFGLGPMTLGGMLWFTAYGGAAPPASTVTRDRTDIGTIYSQLLPDPAIGGGFSW